MDILINLTFFMHSRQRENCVIVNVRVTANQHYCMLMLKDDTIIWLRYLIYGGCRLKIRDQCKKISSCLL